ncbi:MAG TPA: hypothetical protein P5287_01750 [bacterium]|nr:hypothetical protein [bacterium]
MSTVDLLIAWEWEYDHHFIQLLNNECVRQGISTYLIYPFNIDETFQKIRAGELQFRILYDRASDSDERFLPLVDLAKKMDAGMINELSNSLRAMDKATMHLEFLTHGIHVPYTVILSPYEKEPILKITELEGLGRPFIIKPANGGGGTGVVVGAETLHDVIETRKQYGSDKYLLQEQIVPADVDGKRAWFRVFFCCGKTVICWWDDRTHIYEPVTAEQEAQYKLERLHVIVRKIADVCKLDFFSTEICKSVRGQFVCVDYVNDPCDMRLKSVFATGVPDDIVRTFIGCIISHVYALLPQKEAKK